MEMNVTYNSKKITKKISNQNQSNSVQDILLIWQKELNQRLKPFIASQSIYKPSWQKLLSQSETIDTSWAELPNLENTFLQNDEIEISLNQQADGFSYDAKRCIWSFDSHFLQSVFDRIAKNNQANFKQAGRLLFFHEALHYADAGHNFGNISIKGLGNFPKMIEQIDYQADVWAICYDMKLNTLDRNNRKIKKYAIGAIHSAIETTFAFLDTSQPLENIKERSFNRILKWYWQIMRIKNLPSDSTIKDILNTLCIPFTIEIAGLDLILENQRLFYQLDYETTPSLELLIFDGNKLSRFDIQKPQLLLEGFQNTNTHQILAALEQNYN